MVVRYTSDCMTRRRKVCVVLASTILLITLFAVEHPAVRVVKGAVAALGIIDSQYTIVGLTDIRSTDHMRGNSSSDVVLIEYSDFECLMCAAMQETFRRMITEQGVLVVSRHMYPKTAQHAFDLAVAAECVGKHGGEASYFAFAEYLYGDGWGRGIDDALVNKAVALGASAQDFQRCIASDEPVREKVQGDSEEGWRLGARGTPYIIVVYKGKPVGISYANTYEEFLKRVTALVARAQ